MTYFGLTDDERVELGNEMGKLVSYFVAATAEARAERDAAVKRADEAEEILARYRRDGARTTDLAAA